MVKEVFCSRLTCSVVVCTRDRLSLLNQCLAAISVDTTSVAEVLVVDSAPRHSSAEQVAAHWGARYILETRPGLSRARNRAARESTADVIIYLDDDAVPESGWLEALLTEFSDPEVAVVAGRVLPPEDGKLQVYVWFGVVDHGAERKVLDRSAPDWYESANFNSILIGPNMAFRKSAFEGWQGFDERIGAGTPIHGGEETKALFELVEKGWRAVYAPGSVVRHGFPRSEEECRRRALMAIEASTVYLILLFVEHPSHRKETWRHIYGRLKRVTPLYSRATGSDKPLIPAYRVLAARMKGVCLYLSMRLLDQGVNGRRH